MARVYYPKKKATTPAAPAAPAAPKAKKTATKKKARKQLATKAARKAVAEGVKSDYLTDVRFAPSAIEALEQASDEYVQGLIERGELPGRFKDIQLSRRVRCERA